AARQGLPVMGGAGNGQTGTDSITGAEQRSQVRLIRDPQRSSDQVVPASVLTTSPLSAEFARSGLLRSRHGRRATGLLPNMVRRLSAAAPGHRRQDLGPLGTYSLYRVIPPVLPCRTW